MFLGVYVLALAQAATPAVEGQTFVTENVSPSYPYELREQVGSYLACLTGGERLFLEDGETNEIVHKRDVERCASEAQSQREAAFEIWKVGRNEEKARTEVMGLFESLGEFHIETGRSHDKFQAEISAQYKDAAND